MSLPALDDLHRMIGDNPRREKELGGPYRYPPGAYEHADATDDDVSDAIDVVRQYQDLNIGITDALNVVLASKHDTTRLFTLDERHYRAITPISGPDHFTLLPLDA